MPEVVELFVVEHAVPYQFLPNNYQRESDFIETLRALACN
ncbi:sodium-dependent bicarbonate transport family permease, partial [Aeromonas veronii]|nr:sodium-dependent bicarbonate transport family permease [Aeromonas veronii]